MDNEQTLAALLAEDVEGYFGRLVMEYQDRLYAFAFRLAESAQDAEDVVQEALLGAYATLLHYPAGRIRMLKLRAWLYKVTLNVFRNQRRGGRVLSVSLDVSEGSEMLDVQGNDEDEPERFLEDVERRQEVAELVRTLPEQYRLVVTCFYFEELAYQEIAELLDLPLGTVKSRLHRGIQAMRQQLQISSEQRSRSHGIY